MVAAHSSVGIILYHKRLHSLLVVRQFRPAVYASRWKEAREEGRPQPPLSAGFTFELCAGIVDKSKSLEDIAREEVQTAFHVQCDSAYPFAAPVQMCRRHTVGACLAPS